MDYLSYFRTYALLEEMEHYLDALVGPEQRIPMFQALATIHLAIYTHELKNGPRGRQEESIDSVPR